MGLRTFAAVVAGALAAHLPAVLLQAQLPGTQASWAWTANTLKCAYRGAGSCSEAELASGGACTVQCSSGTPSVTSVPCPQSTAKQGNDGDAGWWAACKPGNGTCAGQLQIGAAVTCANGTTAAPATTAMPTTSTSAKGATTSAAAPVVLPSAVLALTASFLALAAK
mmetsp:Transcript_77863/g.218199  ORF Transcript_77863/g.218199 Transcript_77863/m.218199 type:complete len:167 (+) Transcript_77863:87-587(+)